MTHRHIPTHRCRLYRSVTGGAAVVLLTSSLLSACAAQHDSEDQGANVPVQVAEAEPVAVETATVHTIKVPISLRLTGTLKGFRQTDLAANAAGRVTRVLVERGQHVKSGAVLAELDTSEEALSLAQAELQVRTSATQQQISANECARYEKLKRRGAISDLEYDQVTAKCKTAPLDLQLAKARESLAQKNVRDGKIRAPFDGVISERHIDVGEYVQASSTVVSIVQNDTLRLEFTVPEAHVRQVQEGMPISFIVPAYPQETFEGKVRFVSGAVRASTRDLVVEALVDNADTKLRPGMFADVALPTNEVDLPAVPQAAVFDNHGKKHLYVIVDKRAEERIIQHGPQIGDLLAVKDGVTDGEQVAVGDIKQLTNGAKVQ